MTVPTLAPHDQVQLDAIRSETCRTLTEVIGPDVSAVALLDFPYHHNFGDSLIWRGTVDHLRVLGLRIADRSDMFRTDRARLAALPDDVPFLMQGGGNYGDVWPWFQAYREEVVTENPRRRIVQLPQSIRFQDSVAAARCNAVMAGHPDYTLLLRDAESMQRASEQLPDVRTVFCPDMALGTRLRVGARPTADPRSVVVLARDDREARFDTAGLGPRLSAEVTDWRHSRTALAAWRLAAAPGSVHRRVRSTQVQRALGPVIQRSYDLLADLNVRSAVGQLVGAGVVVTDRLHAHVLAGLLGIPNVVLDNNYGKISSVVHASTGRFTTTHLVTSLDEAAEVVRAIRDRSDAAGSPAR